MAEVGAGTGHVAKFLLAADIKHLVAFEPADNMFASLERRFSGIGRMTTINSFFEEESVNYTDAFDSVCYVNVLEHIEDDTEALCHAYKALRKKGYVLIFVPALPFLYSHDRHVGHYRRYSKSRLVETVSAAGFSIEKVKYFDLAGIIPWYIAFVLLKQVTTKGKVSLYDRFAVPTLRRAEQLVAPIVGKNLLVVGRKA